ncbi:hypothetical protein COO60DRAFT_1285685 [Scenedesmus sp. NREL 46B-D3]|nr:hypothetical protein COO60DRAFT_1285685 [Scenedesmus sp. NREL 46B-D3]
MQAREPLEEEMEGLSGYGIWRRREAPSHSTITARLITEAVGGVCLLALLCWVIVLTVQLHSLQGSNMHIAPECVHALGGGPVAAGGSLQPIMSEHCTAQLRTYAHGPYWREVELAAGAAMQKLGIASPAVPGSNGGGSSGGTSSSSHLSQRPAEQLQLLSRSLLTAARGAAESSSSSRERVSSSGQLGGPRQLDAEGTNQAG